MKKTARIITAFLLVAIIAFGAAPAAFAEEEYTKEIVWTDIEGSDYVFEYGYQELKLGTNYVTFFTSMQDQIDPDAEDITFDSDHVCYDFVAEKSGFYYIDSENDTWIQVAKNYNGESANGTCENVVYGITGEYEEMVVYIEEGETVIGVYYGYLSTLTVDDNITIEYLGAEIEDYTIDEEYLDDFIIGWNIWEYPSPDFGLALESEVTFDSGESVVMPELYLLGVCSPVPHEGENTAVVEFFGIPKTIKFTAYKLESIVKSAELNNLDYYKDFVIDYTGEPKTVPVTNETLTVNFSDGTSYDATVIEGMADVLLPNGMTVPAYAGIRYNDDGEAKFVITVADKDFAEYEMGTVEYGMFENIILLSDNNFESLVSVFDDIFTGITYLFTDMEFASICFEQARVDFMQIFTAISAFFSSLA